MRVAVHTRVRADRVEEYERAHEAVPAQLTEAIRAAGVTGWTIWRSGTDLFQSSTARTTRRCWPAWPRSQ